MTAILLLISSIFTSQKISFCLFILIIFLIKFYYRKRLGFVFLLSFAYVISFKLFWVDSPPEALAKIFLPFGQEWYSECLTDDEYEVMSSLFSERYPEVTVSESERNWRRSKYFNCSYVEKSLGASAWPSTTLVFRSSNLNLENINNLALNFWEGEPSRSAIPFFITYSVKELVESGFETLARDAYMISTDKASGVLKVEHLSQLTKIETDLLSLDTRVSFLFFSRDQRLLEVVLDGPRFLQYPLEKNAWLLEFLYCVALAVILMALIKNWFLRDKLEVSVFGLTVSLLIVVVLLSKGDFIGPFAGAFGGGDDGLVHYWWGSLIADSLRSLDFSTALLGQEAVFWFTPGFRYVRAMENLLFDGRLVFYFLVLSVLPIILYRLFLNAGLPKVYTFILTVGFLISPLNFFSFLEYIRLARLGYGETFAFLALLLALCLVVRNEQSSEFKPLMRAFMVPILLFLCWFVRPNLVLFCSAIMAFVIIPDLLNIRYKLARERVLVFCFSSLIWFFPLIHNLLFGNQIILISASGSSVSLPYSILDYWEWIFGNDSNPEVRNHLLSIFDNFGSSYLHVSFSWWLGLVVILCLTLGTFLGFRGAPANARLNAMIFFVGFILAFAPMLFVFYPQARYGMVGLELLVMGCCVTSRYALFELLPANTKANTQ